MKTRKIMCVLVAVIMLCTAFAVPAGAASYPESAHNYQNNYYRSWNYYYSPAKTTALLVTFSEDTYTEPYAANILVQSDDNTITVQDVIGSSSWNKRGDFIAVYDGYGDLVGTYDGSELAGVTLFVPGRSFRIVLSTDESVTAYGFKVTNVEPCPADKIFEITYHPCVEGISDYTKIYYTENTAAVAGEPYSFGFYNPGSSFGGWSREENGKVDFNGGEALKYNGEKIDLYAVWVRQLLAPNEVFQFNNSSYYFVPDEGTNGYYLSEEDAKTLQLNLYKTYGIGPFPTPVLSIVLATYPKWDWQGSCYGISLVTALQHYGIIDVLPLQDAENLGQMQLDDDLKSYINYYQAQSATSWLCENKAIFTDGLLYAQCLEDMFNTVQNGNMVLLSFYSGAAFVSIGHTVLLTGAYTDASGNHIITCYDSNRPYTFRSSYYDTRFTLSPDFSSISYSESEKIGAVNWTDDFSQFEAFSIYGDGDAAKWYETFFSHISDVLARLFAILKKMIMVIV